MKQNRLTQTEKIFATDCEGPLSKNDNAFEVTRHFIQNGDKFFALVSKYDDVLADVIKKPEYKPGNTLKLILPFLKAYDATNNRMKEYSNKNMRLVPGAKDTIQFVMSLMPAFIINTGYLHFTYALCDHIGLPYENARGTKLDLDKYHMDENERIRLKEIRKEITDMPMIDIPKNAKHIDDFSEKDQESIMRLNEIFWKEIPQLKSGEMFKEIDPLGGYGKAKAVKEIVENLGGSFDNVIFFGDSITDVSVFQMVRKGGGLTISFNGNEYAIRDAEIAVISGNTIVTSILTDVFNRLGKDAVINMIEEWNYSSLKKYHVAPALLNHILELYPEKLPHVEITTARNMARLVDQSEDFRKKFRGEAIGKLG